MEVVREVVEDELNLNIPIAGLAKNDKHRTNELLYGFPPMVIGMKTDSEIFRLMTRIQDEVHRFAITFHRDKRSKNALKSELDVIKGIGDKTKEALLKSLKSVKVIELSDLQTLTSIIGKSKATIVFDYFKGKKEAAESAK
jgi:excinuclease ABC subunit C